MGATEKIYYIDRRDGIKKEEKIYHEKALRFLYDSPIGRILNILLSQTPLFSHILGWWQRRPSSRKKIVAFISQYEIDPREFAESVDSFPSFNAFFTRELRPEVRPLAKGVIIPADGRYLAYQNIAACKGFIIKGEKFDLFSLLQDGTLANRYEKGSMVIARLCPSDYHRFHFPLDCIPSEPRFINGPLRAVTPIALRHNIKWLAENKRMITRLETKTHGTLLFVEIGATGVGSIHQTFTPNQPVKKGDEKGYFSFGGSSIILLFEPNTLYLAPDLLHNSSLYLETLCLFGQPLETIFTKM